MEELKQLMLEGFSQLNGRMDTMINRMNTLDHRMDKIEHAQTSMEQSMNEKFGALFDAREVQNDVNKAILSDLSEIKNTLKETEIRSISATNFMTRRKGSLYQFPVHGIDIRLEFDQAICYNKSIMQQ